LEISIDRVTPNHGDRWTFAPVALNVVDFALGRSQCARSVWTIDAQCA
jgi:hypothetical protein